MDNFKLILINQDKKYNSRGIVLLSTLLLVTLFLSLLGVYYYTTSHEIASMQYSRNASSGFYASEAGLNVRAELIRQVFVGFNLPSGTSPANECISGSTGTGDFACQEYQFNRRRVSTYASEDPTNPVILTIPPGERYQNLNAQEYRYTASASSFNNRDQLEAKLELQFKSRLVPIFQFAAFYDKDLEILPGPQMILSGPVHTNGDLYLNAQNRLQIDGQVTTAGKLFRGRKDGTNVCNSFPVQVKDPGTWRSLIPTCSNLTEVTKTLITPYRGMIERNVAPVTVPGPEVFDPTPGELYWDRADLRLVLKMNTSDAPVSIEVRNGDNTVNNGATTTINGCSGIIAGKALGMSSMYNYREAKNISLMDIDLRAVLNCLHGSNWFGTGKTLNDSTDGGLVFYTTIIGPNSSVVNKYGVRLRNGATIRSSTVGAPAVRGLTVISNQAIYIQGDYNSSTPRIPAAVMSDSLNVLSNAWLDANSASGLGSRVASNTTINSAFLSGTDTSGGIEGSGGQGGYYNGGLENYPRFHENWGGRTLTYRGSFVSLGVARSVSGRWSTQSYGAPNRDWNYDTTFNNAANLPPITPRFVYLKQELFVRDFGE
jgi:hypothetical protein